jgi:hypothetical protein
MTDATTEFLQELAARGHEPALANVTGTLGTVAHCFTSHPAGSPDPRDRLGRQRPRQARRNYTARFRSRETLRGYVPFYVPQPPFLAL